MPRSPPSATLLAVPLVDGTVVQKRSEMLDARGAASLGLADRADTEDGWWQGRTVNLQTNESLR